jgi:hypothetical protein
MLFLLYKSTTEEKVSNFNSGCGESKIMTMCLIYLAGAFAVVKRWEVLMPLNLVLVLICSLPFGFFLIAAINCN